jgi:hypothetical protein
MLLIPNVDTEGYNFIRKKYGEEAFIVNRRWESK